MVTTGLTEGAFFFAASYWDTVLRCRITPARVVGLQAETINPFPNNPHLCSEDFLTTTISECFKTYVCEHGSPKPP